MVSQLKRLRKSLNSALPTVEDHAANDEARIYTRLMVKLHPKLIVLTHRPEYCPRCQHDLDDTVIEYVAWTNGHLLVIRDVPALRCRVNGHEYILEKTLDDVERLLNLEKTRKLQPSETIQVPVFSLKMTAQAGQGVLPSL